jgi:hypothetical protein
MIRELDFSKITLRIMEHVDNDGEDHGDHVIAKLTGNTIDTLRKALASIQRSVWRRLLTACLEHTHHIHSER